MKYWYKNIILLMVVFLTGCAVSKHIPPGESLYVGGTVKIQKDSLVSAKDAKRLETELDGLLRPVPNTTLFGFPYKVGLYYLFGAPKKEKGFAAWFRRKFGEPPVYVSQRIITNNIGIFQNYLNNEGFFKSNATGKLSDSKGRKARAHYVAMVKPRYHINAVEFVVKDSSEFSKQLRLSATQTYLKKDNPYQFTTIEAERIRIDQYLKTRGFYYFNPDNLIVKVDSTVGNRGVNMFVQLKNDVAQTALKPYYIRNINVYTDYKGRISDSLSAGKKLRSGIMVNDPNKNYRPRIFNEVVGFRKGSLYNSEMNSITLSRFINLKNFKFVRNRYDIVTDGDSAQLDAQYFLTPMKKKSLRAELNAATKSNNTTGGQLDLSWTNKNIFGGAEYLRISGNLNLNFQLGGNRSIANNDYRRYLFNAELGFPRFIIPFFRYRPEISRTLPSTSLKLGYEIIQQPSVYSQNSTSAEWGYTWSHRSTTEHTFVPFRANLLSPGRFGEDFVNKLFDFTNPASESDINRYLSLLENRVILETSYNISYHPLSQRQKNNFLINGGINLAGNVSGLAIRPDSLGKRTIFNIPIEQYIRADMELKYYSDLTPGIRWANRLFTGFGLPYGNSLALPQIRQYFSGGSSGLRGFQARNVGPGNSAPDDSTTQSLFRNSAFGDIKLELNSELRLKLTSLFQFALFADAGNVWSYRANNIYSAESVFKKDFYKQLAVDGGLGLRLDFTYLVFRLDVAIPFRKPWYATIPTDDSGLTFKNPWVFDEINFRNKAWRKENLILNIAIGMPF